jgi:hypothetical protein
MAACLSSLAPFGLGARETPHFAAEVRRQLPQRGLGSLVPMLRPCDDGPLQKGSALTCHGSAGTAKGGPPMSGTQLRPALASYRDCVTELMEAGQPFGDVEDSIDAVDDLTTDEKAALWLFAFSLRAPSEQQLDARAHLYSLR